MAVLKGAAAESFIRRPSADIACALVYGADSGAVRETVEAIVVAVAGALDDPFAVSRLDERQVAQDAGRLADEVGAMPLLGSRRVVWVGDPGASVAQATESLLETAGPGNLVVLEAGELAAKARLRTLCEASPRAAVIAHYPEEERDVGVLVARELRSVGLMIAGDARDQLLALLSGGRADTRQQLAKLAAYCLGQKEVTLGDVEACCSDASEAEPDDLIDAALGGDLDETDRQLARLAEAGLDPSRLLSAAGYHIGRLQRMRLEVDRRVPLSQAVRSARPAVFYRRQTAVTRQVQAFDGEALASMMATVSSATRMTREFALNEDAIAARAFLSLARRARARQ